MKQFKNILMASALLCGAFFTACDDNDEKPVFPENQENVYDMSGFAQRSGRQLADRNGEIRLQVL